MTVEPTLPPNRDPLDQQLDDALAALPLAPLPPQLIANTMAQIEPEELPAWLGREWLLPLSLLGASLALLPILLWMSGVWQVGWMPSAPTWLHLTTLLERFSAEMVIGGVASIVLAEAILVVLGVVLLWQSDDEMPFQFA